MIAMSEEQIHECLTDAGCDKELIKEFETYQSSGRQKEQLWLLGDYRHLLLERIHAEQKKIGSAGLFGLERENKRFFVEEGKH